MKSASGCADSSWGSALADWGLGVREQHFPLTERLAAPRAQQFAECKPTERPMDRTVALAEGAAADSDGAGEELVEALGFGVGVDLDPER